MPTCFVPLNGSGSFDPEFNISAFEWKKIVGPPSFDVVNTGAIETMVTNLIKGIYQFELKVTDAGGLFGLDTLLPVL